MDSEGLSVGFWVLMVAAVIIFLLGVVEYLRRKGPQGAMPPPVHDEFHLLVETRYPDAESRARFKDWINMAPKRHRED